MFSLARITANQFSISLSVLAILGSLFSVWLTHYYNTVAQDRQARLERVAKFDGSSSKLIAAAGDFITAINENQGLSPAREQLRKIVAEQIYMVDGVSRDYGDGIGKLAGNYQQALSELNQIAQKTTSPTEMRPWTETFGRVLDTKDSLVDYLYAALGRR